MGDIGVDGSDAVIALAFVFFLGVMAGIAVMCIVQINRE